MKMISLRCPRCGKVLNIPSQYAGKAGRCNGCGGQIIVPICEQPTVFLEQDAGPHVPDDWNLPAPYLPSPRVRVVHDEPTDLYDRVLIRGHQISAGEIFMMYIVGLFVPIIGVVFSVYLGAKGKLTHGILLAVISIVALTFWWGFMSAMEEF